MKTCVDRRERLAACLAMLCLIAGSAIAQPPPPLPSRGEGAADAPGDDVAVNEPNVRRIYVPTTELNALLRGDRQGVLLPREEFARLYQAARDAEEAELHHPSGAVVTGADYRGEIAGDQLLLSVEIRFTQFEDGWQMVRLPVGGLSVRSAVLDDAPAAVAREGADSTVLDSFSNARGDHQLALKLSTPLKSLGSDWLAEFQTLGAPSGVLSLAVAEGKTLLVDGLKYDRPSGNDGGTYRVPLGGRSRVSLRITDRDLRNAADSLVFATTAYGLQVAPGEVTWTTQTSVQAFGQSLNQLAFTVPKQLEVASVESTGLEEWTLGDTDRGRRTLITLTYRQPFDGERTVTIRGVLVPDGDEWTVPNLELQNVDSHAAVIVVRHGPEVRLQPEYGDEVRPVAEANEPRSLQFRTMVPAFDLQFRTLGKERSVQVAMTNLLDVSDDGLNLQTVMDVDTYFVPLFDVLVTLPADFEVTSALVGETPVEWSITAGAAGVIEVRIPLEPPMKPGDTRRVTLSAHADPEDWPVERDPVTLPFPEIGLPQADMVEARFGIMADHDLDVRTIELAGLDPARQGELEGLRQAAAALNKELRLGFNYQDTLFSGQLEISRKPTRLAVSTLSLSRLDPQAVHTSIRAFVTVEGGGTEGLLVELPESTGTNLRFSIEPIASIPGPDQSGAIPQMVSEPVAIVEQTAAAPVNGRRTWALRFDRRMRGEHVLSVSLLEPRTDDAPVILPIVSFTGAERQNGWVAVEAREEQRLRVTATDADGLPLLAVDPIDLPGMGQDVTERRRIVAGVRYVRLGYTVTVEDVTFEAMAVPTALADRLSAVSVLGESGLLQHQLDVTFRAVGMQSLRFVLPPGADVWAVLIDGTPVEVRRVGDTYQVPLTSVDDPAVSRCLRLVYRSQIDKPGSTGRLQQSPPELAAVSGAGKPQPLEILQQEWTLHYPHDVVLLSSRGLFAPPEELPPDGWLTAAKDGVTLPTPTEAGWRIGIAAAIVLALWVVVLIWRSFRFSSIATVLIGVLILGVLVALLLPATQQAREAARRVQPADSAATVYDDAEPESFDMEASGGFSGGGGFDGRADDAQMTPPAAPAAENATPMFGLPQTQMPRAESGAVEMDRRVNDPSGMQLGAGGALQGQAAPFGVDGEATPARTPAALAMARGALLSLSLDLEAPEGTRTQTFRTLAPIDSGAVPDLDVSYATRSFREVIVLILAAGLALLMWLQRHATIQSRLALVLVTIVVPVAVAPITPPLGTMVVEGVLLGGLAGLVLWGVLGIVKLTHRCCEKWCPPKWMAKSAANTAAGLLVLAGSLMCAGVVPAEEPPVGGVMKGPASPAPKPDLPTVVVPYDEGGPFAAERVYLPQELFRELWLKANPDQRPRAKAPVDGLVAEALYSIDVGDPAPAADGAPTPARVRARYVIFGFRDEPVWVPLPLDQVAVTSAALGEHPAVLQPRDKGRPAVLIRSVGLHVLDLEFDVPADLRTGSGEFTLPLSPVASGALTLSLPRAEDERTIRILGPNERPVASRITDGDDGRQRVEVSVDQGGPLQVSWQPKATRGAGEAIVHVESKTAVEIADDGVQMTADFAFQVRQGVLAEIRFLFPDTLRLKRITGPDVGGWQMGGAGEERTLTIFLRRNVQDQTSITAELFVPQDDGSDDFDVSVPPFAPLDVTRETGEVAVLAGAHLDVRATASEGLRQINRDSVTLPTAARRETAGVQLAYRFTSRPWELALSVSPTPPKVTADSEHGVSVGHRKVMYSSRLQFHLAGAPRQTLRIALTDDFLLTNVLGEGIEDWFMENAELVIDFGQPRVGDVAVVLEGHVPRDADDNAAVIITPLPLELDRQQSALAVWIDPMYAATLDSFDTWRTIDRGELSADLRELQSGEPQFAFRSADVEPEIINLDLVQQQPQLVTDAVTLIAVSDVSVDYGLTLRWTIERAATDLLAFTVPSWLEDRLEITGPNIRQMTQELTDDGRVRWTVQTTDAVRGPYLLSAVATLPPPTDGRIAAPAVGFEQPPTAPGGTYASIAGQQTFAVLVNLSRGRLSAVGNLGELTARREQLPLVLRNDLVAQAMAIVRVPAATDVVWTLERVAEHQAQAAQVTAAELTSVLAMDGSLRTMAQYRVRNRGQQFLALKLPESTRILSVLVKGEPARCLSSTVGEQPVTLVPLPQTSAADLSFLVQVVLQDRLADVKRLDAAALGEDVSLPVPSIVSPAESREYGVPVVHTSWTVYLPDVIDASAIDDPVRTNVSLQPSAAAREMTELQLYRELADLNRLLTSKDVSSAQRLRAANNVDQLSQALGYNYRQSSSGGRELYEYFSDEDRDLAERKQELLEESFRNVQQAQQDVTRGGAVTREDMSADGTLNANGLGRSFILGNSIVIADDNFGGGTIIAGEKLKGFRVESGATDKESGIVEGKSVEAKPVESRSKLRGRLESQVPMLKQAAEPQRPASADVERAGRMQSGLHTIESGRFLQDNGDFAESMALGAIAGGQSDGGVIAGLPIRTALGVRDEWFEAGGLSLPIELPTEGQSLTFTKLGGDPRLSLSVRPRETGTSAVRWLWAIVVFAAGAWLLHQAAHQATIESTRTGLSVLLVAVGLVGLLCLPLPLSIFGGVMLVVGSLMGLLQWQAAAQSTPGQPQ